mgnify:CR=1 FL=1
MSIEDARKTVDEIDKDIVRLLSRRADAALRIGREKRKEGLPVCDPSREEDVLKRALAMNEGPLDDGMLEGIYREIMAACLSVQKMKPERGLD